MDTFFYPQTLRRTTIQFLNIFNNIKIAKYNPDDTIREFVKVPLKYAPKAKFFYWLYQRKHEVRLPMMAAYITEIEPAVNDRMNNKNSKILSCNQQYIHKTLVPYSVGYELVVSSQHHNEVDQIFEQIIPYFTPYVMTRINIDEIGNYFDCKVILNSISPELETEIPEDDYRTINWRLSFTVHTYAFQAFSDGKYIEEIFLKYKDMFSCLTYETMHTSGYKDDSGNIISSFDIIPGEID